MNRDKLLLEFVALAKVAIANKVMRNRFVVPSGDPHIRDWERKARGLAYDVAKGMAVAAKAHLHIELPTKIPGLPTMHLELNPGMGAYAQVGSDRYPYTLIGYTTNGRNIFLTQDVFTRTDKNGQSEDQTYEFKANPNAVPVKAVWSEKYGRYYIIGGSGVRLGTRRAYQDPGF